MKEFSIKFLFNHLNDFKKIIFLILFFVLLLFFIKTNFVSDVKIEAKVVSIVDGDSLEIYYENKKEKVRLFGIDAPELNQEYGKESKKYLQLLLLNKKVILLLKSKDKYDRMIAIVLFKNKDINSLLVKKGFAWAYLNYSDLYIKEEEYAKKHKLGLWSLKSPINPQKWRKLNQIKAIK